MASGQKINKLHRARQKKSINARINSLHLVTLGGNEAIKYIHCGRKLYSYIFSIFGGAFASFFTHRLIQVVMNADALRSMIVVDISLHGLGEKSLK